MGPESRDDPSRQSIFSELQAELSPWNQKS
ncbi:MAG: hypothetical protein JWO82_2431, partial [Akkermansiaceae bacterium]|nr:hypothetical protein [Akkermansiaceae bacterium]